MRNSAIAIGLLAVAFASYLRRFGGDVNAYSLWIALAACAVIVLSCTAHAYIAHCRSIRTTNLAVMPFLIAGAIAGYFLLRRYLGLDE